MRASRDDRMITQTIQEQNDCIWEFWETFRKYISVTPTHSNNFHSVLKRIGGTHSQWPWRRWRRSSLSWYLEKRSQIPRLSDCSGWSKGQWRICLLLRGQSWSRCHCKTCPVVRPSCPANQFQYKASPQSRWHTKCRRANERWAQRCTWAGRGQQPRIQNIGPVFLPHGPVSAAELFSAGLLMSPSCFFS